MPLPSPLDDTYQAMARAHIQAAVAKLIVAKGMRVLEIGPADDGCADFGSGIEHVTLDLKEGCDIQADITKRIPANDRWFDVVLCMEVLEHTRDPFAAVAEIRRVLKNGGYLLASAPLNFRQHGPQPDCWRFTENGWLTLLKDWDGVEIDALETPDRPLFPVHYVARAICNKDKSVDAATMEAAWITK